MSRAQSTFSTRIAALLVSAAVLLSAVAFLVFSIVERNGGTFTYTLDDPYIHLALARNIGLGHYGINAGEFSSPSSSILWPLLLAPFAAAAWGQYVPLALNILIALATLHLAAGFIAGQLQRHVAVRYLLPATLLALVLFMFATNMVGLVFTGMEHSAHVLSVVAVVAGLALLIEHGRVSPLLVVAIVAGPLLRYESLAISGVAIVMLFLQGRHGVALLLAGGVALLVGGFSAFLMALDLPLLPNSVIAKSIAATSTAAGSTANADAGSLAGMLQGLNLRLNNAVRLIVVTGVALLACAFRLHRQQRPLRAACAVLFVLPLIAHLLVGRFGWFYRYEMYMLAWCLLALVFWYGDIRQLFGAHTWLRRAAVVLLLGLVVGLAQKPGGRFDLQLDAASDIHDQHFLMSRIARQYGAPVALNDIGAVAYLGDNYVLDLWGLASNTALQHRLARSDSRWMAHSAAEHDVKLAMLYESWFPALPAGWLKVGELRLNREATSAGGNRVTIYVLDHEQRDEVTELLQRVQQVHPEQVVVF